MTDLLRDCWQAFRGLMRNPGLTVAAVLSLSLGIGLNSTVYSVLHTVLEPPSQESGWVNVYINGRGGILTYSEFRTLHEHSRTLAHVVLADFTGLSITRGGRAQFVPAAQVSPDFFAATGYRPVFGRVFGENEPDAVVLTYGLWKRQFGGDPRVLGQKFPMAGRALTIVGIAPPELRRLKAMQIEAIVPYQAPSSTLQTVAVLVQLKSGTTPPQAEAEIGSLLQPQGNGPMRVMLQRTFGENVVVQAGALLIQCVIGLILLIACANVANLLLARNEQRSVEIGVRLAMGASNWRLVRHLLVESVMLGLLAAPAGLLLAVWAIDAIRGIRIPSVIPIVYDFKLDVRVLGFGVAVSILAGLLAGLVPARAALRAGLASTLRGGAARRGFRRFSFGGALVAAQVAVSLVWLTAAGMLCRGLMNVRDVDPGFKTGHRLVAVMMPVLNGYSPARANAFCRALRPRLEALDGVASVSIADEAPLSPLGGRLSRRVHPTGSPSAALSAGANRVEPGYFQTLGIPLLNGSDFRMQDLDGPKTAIVNETLAQRFWPGQNPVGKTLTADGSEEYRLIGVARDSKHNTLAESPRPFLYLPMEHDGMISVLLQTKGDPAAAQAAVRNTIAAVDPDLPLVGFAPLEEAVAYKSEYFPRLAAAFALMASLLAVSLSALGLYSTVSYFVSRRTREIGIHMALGASPASVFAGVFRQGWRAVAVGCGAGLPLSLGVSYALKALVYGVSVADPTVFAPVCLFLCLVVSAALYFPARRATRIEPNIALREG
jgi:predicted permease